MREAKASLEPGEVERDWGDAEAEGLGGGLWWSGAGGVLVPTGMAGGAGLALGWTEASTGTVG